jgi:CPA2 family monovalent cation:H+ antiporter-2
MAAGAGLDARLAPFIAGYVLVLAILGPIAAGQAHLLARALRAAQDLLPGRTAPSYDTEPRPQGDSTPSSASAAVPAEAER